MATITFKAKINSVYTHDDKLSYGYIKVPIFKKHHCDMNAFRQHRKYGSFVNSNIFNNLLARLHRQYFPQGILKLHNIPDGVAVDSSGFLTTVTIEV